MSLISPLLNFVFNDTPHLINSIKFNFHYFNFSTAVKFPVWVSRNVDIHKLKGQVIINDRIHFKKIKIGFGHVPIFDKKYERSILSIEGTLIFNGEADLGHKTRIHISPKGTLEIGHNTCITAACSIICEEKISIGDNCLISWNTLIMDTDYHDIYDKNGIIQNQPSAIEISNKTWIGANSTILKGVKLMPNTIVGANSLVNKKQESSNVLIAGNPARIIKENVSW